MVEHCPPLPDTISIVHPLQNKINLFISQVVAFLEEHFGADRLISVYQDGDNISFNSRDIDLRVRYDFSYTGMTSVLCISKIFIVDQRKGHGTAVVRFLQKLAGEHGLRVIELEDVRDLSMVWFAKKCGFERNERGVLVYSGTEYVDVRLTF